MDFTIAMKLAKFALVAYPYLTRSKVTLMKEFRRIIPIWLA
jgi:hypothetical protein